MDLDKLKKQWVLPEATRKGDETRNIGRLETLKGASDRPPLFESHREGAQKSKELARRRAMYAGTKQPQRKVFSCSRHTRALSLLAPDPAMYDRRSRIGGALRLRGASSTDPKLGRPSTVPDSLGSTAASPKWSAPASMLIGVSQPKDAILQTGKQIVGDFKEGLWTFIDDLGQATVGGEAVHGPVRSADDRALSSSTKWKTARKPITRTGLHLKNMPSKRRDVIFDVLAAYLQNTGHGGDPSPHRIEQGSLGA
ncbi:MAG: hypothetical protein LQ347_000828 [Umbilicaria vellea]|nr:MAG: hypothetical protein LQ347_000828 [Umbilicaria vellea]